MTTGYDVHLASDVMSSQVVKKILDLGFRRDAFIGGTTGVVHPCHYSFHPCGEAETWAIWNRAIEILRATDETEFHGYAEAEVTPPGYRVELPWKDFNPTIAFPFERFSYNQCPLDKHKDFDIHVTADLATVDPRLQELLERTINFNYVGILKPSGKTIRVYTFQPLGPGVQPIVFARLLDYFRNAGGMQGKIKLEMCTYFERFPKTAAVCPIVSNLQLRATEVVIVT